MKNFSLKFIDVMIGVTLGLGFQWWPDLTLPWQYIAFIFAYVDVVDYWIDYGPSLKKFPPKYQRDIFLDIAIMFMLFLYIYSTQRTIMYFFISFIIWRALDALWLLSSRSEYKPKNADRKFVNTWIKLDVVEAVITLLLVGAVYLFGILSLPALLLYIFYRLVIRIYASLQYKMVYFK